MKQVVSQFRVIDTTESVTIADRSPFLRACLFAEIDEQGLSLVAQMALLFLQQDLELTCLPHGLCRLNQRARSVGPTHYLATKLAR